MSGKPKLYYFNGRGKMESIRWLLAAAGVQFDEEYLERKDQYEKLLQDGALMFQQVPMVEMDGMKMVQTRAILNYIAGKHHLYGKNLKERALIDMYAEGARDLLDLVMRHPFLPPTEKENNLSFLNNRATNRYFPVFEKALSQNVGGFLVGDQLSMADVQVLEVVMMVEEKFSSILSSFPELQAFKAKLSSIPTFEKLLQPGSPRKPPPNEKYVQTVKEVLQL
ncbi:glutathione S-transferase, alpha tandem duplicate 1 isoform X2 [Latimeria chalumnae]|uniref:glutathione S-transferase, alpha tandem duplicate 1 isoform X2 n=1 Tax=Latimeria chalumnae TaxID=7897 RepID=UPI0006D8E7FE|nr:PREDICTED: glutathione S-transferase 3-like [Latimeria chalumnae]|eukprot:XP_006004809.2 PREDICTED: glutathione S-transferase 3-like [Latimeria chalumnae]